MLDNESFRRQLLAIFRQELAEHVEAVRAILTGSVEAGSDRRFTAEEIDEIFRRLHSLKGAARAVDNSEIEQIAHQAESVLGQIRSGKDRTPRAAILIAPLSLILDAAEMLASADTPELAGEAGRIADDARAALTSASAALSATEAADTIAASPVASQPAKTDSTLAASPEPPSTIAEPITPSTAPVLSGDGTETIRVRVDLLDRMAADIRQIERGIADQASTLDEMRQLEQRIDSLIGTFSNIRQESLVKGVDTALPVKEETLYEARAAIMQSGRIRRSGQERIWRLSRLAGSLAENAGKARLVEAATAAEGLGPMVRQLARDEGKEVEFHLIGGETPIDRQVAQVIRDPLRHLLRNTISHGIERPEEREVAGKSRSGLVELGFRVRGAQLEVDIDDDGRGFDTAVILRNGLEAGLISPEEAATAGSATAARLIFESGFSTAQSADRLAGRGMGLSVVARNVARLGGSVTAMAHPRGKGARFRLRLPLSLASNRLLFVEAGAAGQVFGFPTFAVEALHRVSPDRIERVEGRRVIRLQGLSAVPVADLSDLLGLPPGTSAAQGNDLLLIEAMLDGTRWAIHVERLREEGDFQVHPLGPYLQSVRLFGGSVLLREGAIGLALLPGELASRARSLSGTAPQASGSAPSVTGPALRARRTQTILVVDDSITTRALEQSILEAHGYKVRLAVDGADALVQLQEVFALQEEVIDLIVSDLEMPRMTGFDLLTALKKDARLAAIPFILVTSREAFEDRERGLTLGADAYIVKRKFDQQELLQAIEQLLLQV